MIDPVYATDMKKDVAIFIADDSPIDRMVLEGTLRNRGYNVSAFNDGSEMLQMVDRAETPVIVLLDWMMPGLSGVDICRKLHSVPPVTLVYSIMITGRSATEDIAFALDNGADDVMAKPIAIMELQARINVGIRFLMLRQQLLDSNKQLREHARMVEVLAEERADQLMRADRLSTIGLLSAGIAHEINNPTSFISINIQTLEENLSVVRDAFKATAADEIKQSARNFINDIPEIIGEMKDGIVRIRTIINALKTYVHAHPDLYRNFNIIESVDSALHLCANRLKYGIQVEKNYEVEGEMTGDQYRMEQVFVNILTNAADAIEEKGGKGTIAITVTREESMLVVRIRDDGPGFPPGYDEKLFMPFYTTKDLGKGTGLGLSVSRNIIEDHRGSLKAGNHPEGGAEFVIRLPNGKDMLT